MIGSFAQQYAAMRGQVSDEVAPLHLGRLQIAKVGTGKFLSFVVAGR